MTIFTDKIKKYDARLQRDLAINHEQSSGIWGNIGAETGGFKYLQELNPTVKGSAGGYGWKQWTGPRGRAYRAWCKVNKLNPADDESNYLYVVWEGRNTEKTAISKLQQAKTIEEATELYMKYDLRPGSPHLESRLKWAKEAYNVSATSTVKTVATHPITKTIGVVVAGGTAATQVTPVDYWPYIMYGGIGILSVAIIVYILVRYIQYKKS